LERAALQERLRGGDPFLGMTEAGFHFHHARDRNDPSALDRGLAVLIRHFAADELATPEFRRDLLKRFAKLAEAQEAGSSVLALEARYPPEGSNVMEERAGSLTRMTVNLTATWNRTVEEFARALQHLHAK
jgi:hypothetical protein